ncbi:MAG: hypothetical protein NW214_08315 [Pseudanabaenaceae cyanobacterium bins.39]|nr:hypothetical protein [Pseudanabaenaceae cyanobacterium bins.39]
MRKYRYSSSWQNKRKSWFRNTLIIILVGLPLLIIAAEFMARGVFLATGMANQVLPSKTMAIANAYAFKLADRDGNTYPGLSDYGQLRVKRSPVLGYELFADQSSEYWRINAQGFRAESAIAIEKPANEIRVFLMGGSTAFTNMADQEQKSLAVKLEKLLNDRVRTQNASPEKFKPKVIPYFADQIEAIQSLPPRIQDGNYRVITAAVPGYSSGNELAMLAHRVIAYSPNLFMTIDGYEDMRSPSYMSANEIANIEQVLRDPIAQYRKHESQKFNNWLNSLYLVKVWQKWIMPSSASNSVLSSEYQIFNAEQFSDDAEESQKRIDRYVANLAQMHKISANIPMLVALQPEITGKQKSLTPEEDNIVKALGNRYRDRAVASYQLAEQALKDKLGGKLGNTKFINFYQLFQDQKQQAFIDPIHLTEAANDLIAQKLYENIAQVFAVQPSDPNAVTQPALPLQ